MMDISIPYYEDLTRISNSNIGWFLKKGPSYLHKMLTNPPPEEKNNTLERGTMIHEYLLQPEEFQKDYVVWDKRRPSSAQQEKFCRELANSLEIEPNKAVLSAYKASYSTTNRSDEKMLSEGLKIASELKEYIDFLKSNDCRKMIGVWDIKMLERIKDNVKKHKTANKLLNNEQHIETHHEFHINWEFENVKCKSLLDGVSFDLDKKICIMFDLKTTQKLWTFEESMNTYDYLRQLMYYTMAVKWYLETERSENTTKWTFEWYIIGIDTAETNEIRVFSFDEKQLKTRVETIQKVLIDISWHQKCNLWEHSRKYYEGDGSEKLNL